MQELPASAGLYTVVCGAGVDHVQSALGQTLTCILVADLCSEVSLCFWKFLNVVQVVVGVRPRLCPGKSYICVSKTEVFLRVSDNLRFDVL